MPKLESTFQSALIKELEAIFPGCFIYRGDPQRQQGIPDLLILFGNRWAALELKREAKASKRPNQDYYVNQMNELSYAAFIFPDNKEAVLNELQEALRPRRSTRISQRK